MSQASSLPSPSGAPTAAPAPDLVTAVVAAAQRSMEQALAEQQEHGRLLRSIVARTTDALHDPAPGPSAAASLAEIEQVTTAYRERAAQLSAALRAQVDSLLAKTAASSVARVQRTTP